MKRWIGLLAGLVFAGTAAAAPTAACQAQFARQKVNLVVPFKPGGGYDLYARLLAPALETATGMRTAVVNMPAAQGHVAMKTIAQPPASAITLGLMDVRHIMSRRLTEPTLPPTDAYVPLGSFGQSIGLWAARAPAAEFLASREPITAPGGGGVAQRVLLPAMLLEREVRLVHGYVGMSERVMSLMRGETDMVDGPDDSIVRLIAGGGAAPVLLMSREPVAAYPGVAYLAGPGGLVDERTKKLDPAKRRRAMELADVAVGLSSGIRTVVAARTMKEPLRQCLEKAVEEALFSPELREAAAKQQAPYEPLRAAHVKAETARVERLMNKHIDLIRELAVRARS